MRVFSGPPGEGAIEKDQVYKKRDPWTSHSQDCERKQRTIDSLGEFPLSLLPRLVVLFLLDVAGRHRGERCEGKIISSLDH